MKNYIFIGALLVALAACRKEGFTLPAEGEQVPYQDTLKVSLTEVLKQSPAQRFYKAWQRSNLPRLLDSLSDGKTMYTILAPDDAALEQGGYTEQVLQTMEVRMLDSLLMFYVLRQRITKEDLTNRADDFVALSLLNKPGLLSKVGVSYVGTPYYYRQYLQVRDGKMIANGKVAGAGQSFAAKDGYLWILNKTIPVPDKTVLEVLRADGRFTILLETIATMRRYYVEMVNTGVGYPAYPDPVDADLYLPYGWMVKPPEEFGNPNEPNISFSTFFIPSDDAFRAAGFNSVADLMAFNERKGLPYWNPDWGMVEGTYTVDTLLDYHYNWGFVINQISPGYLNGGIVFFNHMLTTPVVANYPIVANPLDQYDPGPDPAYYMPYTFSRNAAGQVQMKVKGSEAPAATVIDTDINTLMGPIHVVDRLLIPKGYKID